MNQAYGRTFAKVYDMKWTAFAKNIAPKLEALFQSREAFGRVPKTLLDICCGTGQLAGFFLSRGYTVHGLDLSPSMLVIAIDNNESYVSSGTATFTVQDAGQLRLSTSVSYAVCLFDSMNHLASSQSVHACMRRVHDVLSPGGMFIFDINTRKGLHRWNGVSIQEDDDVFILNRGVFADGMDRAYTNITGFLHRTDDTYERFQETVHNLVLPVNELLSSLKDIGFTKVYCASPDELCSTVPDPESQGRVFIVSEKNARK
jgi:SAM-dependent methyltransferase